jgi:Ion channel
MVFLTIIVTLALIFIILWDAFEVMILPRRVTRRVRLSRLFYRSTWRLWSAAVRRVQAKKRRETLLSFYGPLSLIFLLSTWAAGLIFSFGLLYWALDSALLRSGFAHFPTDLYLSGTTFFTLGLGDVIPRGNFARVLAVSEAGLGFGFLAIVIGYLPVLYQSFSRREVSIVLLDARAGSPPSAGELLRRHAYPHGIEALRELLREWERWSAELLESHLSYPALSYFRSQHDNQSWLAALCTILDVSAILMAGIEGACERQAELTFAIARHAVVDLAQVFVRAPQAPANRLPPADLDRLRAELDAVNLRLRRDHAADRRLEELRALYEPHVHALAEYLCFTLPRWLPKEKAADNWQTSAWGRSTTVATTSTAPESPTGHF